MVLTLKQLNLVIFLLGGKFDKTFGNDQCADIGVKKYKDVAKCTTACKNYDQCTAVNYCKNYECVFRKCGSPLPEPTGPGTGGCIGYASAGNEYVKKENKLSWECHTRDPSLVGQIKIVVKLQAY